MRGQRVSTLPLRKAPLAGRVTRSMLRGQILLMDRTPGREIKQNQRVTSIFAVINHPKPRETSLSAGRSVSNGTAAYVRPKSQNLIQPLGRTIGDFRVSIGMYRENVDRDRRGIYRAGNLGPNDA